MTWQHKKPQYLLFFISPTFHMKKIDKNIPCSGGNSFPLRCHSVCASLKLLPACYLEEHIPCRGGHPSERRVALIRRCHLLGAGTDLAWRERRSDSPATKISPFRRQEEKTCPHPPASPRCRDTRTQSQKEQSIRAHTCSSGLSARIYVTGSLHVESDWGGQ